MFAFEETAVICLNPADNLWVWGICSWFIGLCLQKQEYLSLRKGLILQ